MNKGPYLCLWIFRRLYRPADIINCFPQHKVQHGRIERRLVTHLVIECRFVHPGSPGNGIDLCSRIALLGKDLCRNVDNIFSRNAFHSFHNHFCNSVISHLPMETM